MSSNSYTRLYITKVERVMQDRFGAYIVSGTVKLDSPGAVERAFTLCCDGIVNSRMIKVTLEFNRISDNEPVSQEYMKFMFKEICDTCFSEVMDYMDTATERLYS